jgi:hypothetical protein
MRRAVAVAAAPPRTAEAGEAPVSAATGSLSAPRNSDRQWNLFTVEANLAWGVTLGHRQVKVAVLDSGICEHQVDMAAN